MHGSHTFFLGAAVFVGLVVGFLGLVVLIFSVSMRASTNRRRDLARCATLHGFTYIRRLPGGKPPLLDIRGRVYASPAVEAFLQQFGDCRLFSNGSWRDVQNVMIGYRDGQEWTIFDYSHWSEGRGQQESEVVDVTCVVLRARHGLGRFSVEPKLVLLGALAALADPRGIVKTGDGAFDAKFIVRAVNTAVVPFALTDAVRQFLLGLYHGPRRWYRQLYVHDTWVIVTESRASAPHIEDMMEIAAEFARLAERYTP